MIWRIVAKRPAKFFALKFQFDCAFKNFQCMQIEKGKLKLKFLTTHLKNATLFCNNSTFYVHSCPLHDFDQHEVCRSLWSTFGKTAFPSLQITFAADLVRNLTNRQKKKQRVLEMSATFLHPLIFPSWLWRQSVKRWMPSIFSFHCTRIFCEDRKFEESCSVSPTYLSTSSVPSF